MALAEMQYPGWLGRLLTHPVRGLQNYAETKRLLTEEKSTIKVFVELYSLWSYRFGVSSGISGPAATSMAVPVEAGREGCTVASAAQPSPSSSCTPNRARKGAD